MRKRKRRRTRLCVWKGPRVICPYTARRRWMWAVRRVDVITDVALSHSVATYCHPYPLDWTNPVLNSSWTGSIPPSIRKVTYFKLHIANIRNCPRITFIWTSAASSYALFPIFLHSFTEWQTGTFALQRNARAQVCNWRAMTVIYFTSNAATLFCTILCHGTVQSTRPHIVVLKDADVTIWKFGVVISYKFSSLSVSLSFSIHPASPWVLLAD